jgi:hypothetical protein
MSAAHSMYELRKEAIKRGIKIPRWINKEELYDLIIKDKMRKGERENTSGGTQLPVDFTAPESHREVSGPIHYLLLDVSTTPVDVVVVSVNKEEFLIRVREELGLGKDAKLRIPKIIGSFQILKYPSDNNKGLSSALAGVESDRISLQEELLDLREEWLAGRITNTEIESIMTNLYPERGTYEGELISDIVRDITDELKKYGEEDLREIGFTNPTDFILIYDLNNDSINYYPVKDVIDSVDNGNDLVVLYSR